MLDNLAIKNGVIPSSLVEATKSISSVLGRQTASHISQSQLEQSTKTCDGY